MARRTIPIPLVVGGLNMRPIPLCLLASAVLLVGSLPAVAADPARAQAGSRTAVSVALDWTPNTNHTGVFVAQQQGWYAAEGLDVTILPYAEGSAPEGQVATGQANFGFSFEEGVTAARAADRPIVSLAAVIQKNTSAFVTLKDSGLDRPAKLDGTRYAGFGSPFEEPVIQTVITCDGGPTGNVQNITTNVAGVEVLQAHQADFVWIFQGWEGIAAERQGVELNAMSPLDYCVPNYYTPVIIGSELMIKQQPDVVARFMRATSRGYELAIADPDQAADLLVKAAPPGSFPDPGLVTQSAEWLATRYREGKSRWGEQDLQTWTDYPHFMVTSGHLTDANGATITNDLDYGAAFTNAFLP
jgi:ABC-type nitrate/sulfonate/bicarbonate transport system substrate-binding protein